MTKWQGPQLINLINWTNFELIVAPVGVKLTEPNNGPTVGVAVAKMI